MCARGQAACAGLWGGDGGARWWRCGMMAVQTVGYVTASGLQLLGGGAGDCGDHRCAMAGAKPMLLSDSGDDITLWTGVPAVSVSHTTHGLDAMLERYQPGWYAAWRGWRTGRSSMGTRYRMDAVARYRVFDDPARQTLVLYKLTPR